MQADPLIDGVTDTQGYNRYSYVHNNPLNATDPSGFSAWTRFRDNFLKPVIQAVVTAKCTPCGVALAAATAAYYGGDVFDVAAAAFSTFVMANIGQQFAASGFSAGEAFAFGAMGGVTTVLRGGKFGHGFVSAYAGAVTSGYVQDIGNRGAQLVASSVIAGSISEATGGKFANGAAYAAFSWAIRQGLASGEQGDTDVSNAEKDQLPPHDPNSGAYEVDVPDDVLKAMSNTLGTDVSEIKVIANSKWANLLNRVSGMKGYRVDATTYKNRIYLPSHVSPQEFFNNSELMLHEYYHVVNQWNNGRMNVFNYLRSHQTWESEAIQYAKDRSYIPNHMLFYQGARKW